MKRKITAVSLCVSLLLTLSVNVSALKTDIQTQVSQAISVSNETTVNVEENNATTIEPIMSIEDNISPARPQLHQ